jgi:hypothetical protein
MNQTNRTFSIERDGLNQTVTVRLAPRYLVDTQSYNLIHEHPFTFNAVNQATSLKDGGEVTLSYASFSDTTEPALSETITTSTVTAQAFVPGNQMTIRWMMMN